jgi:uncharacterized RDD family membrane protein YckC
MTAPERTPALLGWRWLALAYDFFPVLALWFVAAGVFTALHGDAVRGGWLGLLEFAVLWLLAGLYAVTSWRRGGQTIGMRPWRLRVVDARGAEATPRALWLRYAVGGVSVLFAGIGFWWAWIDRAGLTWHDRASGTRMTRDPGKQASKA